MPWVGEQQAEISLVVSLRSTIQDLFKKIFTNGEELLSHCESIHNKTRPILTHWMSYMNWLNMQIMAKAEI